MFELLLYLLYVVLLAAFVVGAWRLKTVLGLFRMKPLHAVAKNTLPSVTVCIPVRNEEHAMTEALQRVIASDYPKLEVIVLDDQSGDNTPALIKAFAHEGVRFVEGAPLHPGWLGKNHALQELLHEASGSYVLFMDVDTRIAPHTISQLVAYAQQEAALMVSVLPRREDGPRASVLFSTLRYFWEVMFHRNASPAVASSAWLIERQTLLTKWQGFNAFKADVQPEAKIAAELAVAGQYRFVIGTPQLGLSYEKKWRSQIDTSTRLLFPLIGAKIANAIIAALDLIVLASPLLIVLGGFVFGWGIHQLIAEIFWLLFASLYAVYLRQVWAHGWWIGALLWPVIALQEAFIILKSAERYSKNLVTWKGRKVKAN